MPTDSPKAATPVVKAAPKRAEKRTDVPAEQLGSLVSRLSHPVVVDYGDQQIRMSARGTSERGLVRGRLGDLPSGVLFVPE